MSPRIIDGDVVIIKEQSDVNSGELAIVIINGCEATCKKILKLEHGINLVSFNSVYEPMYYSNEEIEKLPISIIGKVIELRRKF